MKDQSANTEQSRRVYLDAKIYSVKDVKRGGMGRVWLLHREPDDGFDPIYHRRLAVKTFDLVSDQAQVEQELNNWVLLDHPAILPLIRIGRLNFQLAAIMPMKACSLDDILEQRRTLTDIEAKTIVGQMVDALEYAHSRFQLVHLDLKPSNVLADSKAIGNIWIADWGISRIAEKRVLTDAPFPRPEYRGIGTVTSYGAGTPLFMSPERFSGQWQMSIAADVYSIGMMTVLMLSGILPYQFGKHDPMHEVLSGSCASNANVLLKGHNKDLITLCTTCLHPDPTRRPQSYGAIRRLISRI